MTLLTSSAASAAFVTGLSLAIAAPARAADKWIEVKSPHVTVISSASGSSTRKLAWQVEQIRSAITKLFPWARVDLNKPFIVVAVDDEQGMRALAPEYWEKKGGVHPASVWVSGADQYYLAIRTDLEGEDRDLLNPYYSAYFSYASLVLHQSVQANLPHWLGRGLAGVLSNTIVRDNQILLGPPIPWHLEALRAGARLRLPVLLKVTGQSPELSSGEGLSRFDAQAWAFVHFLMFANNGTRRSKLDQFFRLVAGGADPDVTFRETLGRVDALEADFLNYVNGSIFSYMRFEVDAGVKRERFAERALPPAESSSLLALFHTAMRRPVEARAAIAAARKANPTAAEGHVADAILLDQEGKRDEARDAFARAVDGGSTSAYAHYRLAGLRWTPRPDRDTVVDAEKLLTRSVALNDRYAPGYAFLAEVRSILGTGEIMEPLARAVQLEPSDPDHRLTVARILWRQKQHGEALKAVQVALALATTDEERRRARELQEQIERTKPK
jgi:tetratricopeptide (TPR) repeat protein